MQVRVDFTSDANTYIRNCDRKKFIYRLFCLPPGTTLGMCTKSSLPMPPLHPSCSRKHNLTCEVIILEQMRHPAHHLDLQAVQCLGTRHRQRVIDDAGSTPVDRRNRRSPWIVKVFPEPV